MKQKEVLDIFKLGHNVYLTGCAGSGKTFVLNKYIKYLRSRGVGVGITASTGIAATHMDGITIHSWTGIGIRDNLTDLDRKEIIKKRHLIRRFIDTKVLIIDEVSMLHSFRLDLIDLVCKMFKRSLQPFGGMQVILCGDFFQLPPISRNNESADFIYKSDIWNNMDLKVCYLDEQFRQTDDQLIKILNDIRSNKTDDKTLMSLESRRNAAVAKDIEPTKLYTHNFDVDLVNDKKLQEISGGLRTYLMDSVGNKTLAEILKKSCLAPEKLLLKKGAVVMFVKNNFDQGYVNGTVGKIIDFNENNYPIVETLSGKKITATPVSWLIEENGLIKAEIMQLPLRLAWAITVHKSQGMSLDTAEIDLGKTFEKGMGYVALSRVRSLKGIKLIGINNLALEVNQEVLELDKKLVELSKVAVLDFKKLNEKEINQRQNEFLQSITPEDGLFGIKRKRKKKVIKGATYQETKKLVLEKLTIPEMAKSRGMSESTIVAHLEKLVIKKEKRWSSLHRQYQRSD